jgi:hypothetical protein
VAPHGGRVPCHRFVHSLRKDPVNRNALDQFFDAGRLLRAGDGGVGCWGHGASGAHGSDILWRGLHQMHHSAERIDAWGAFYFHPLDMVGWTALSSLTLTVGFGLGPQAVSWFLYVTTFLGVVQHTNVRTPQWLGYLVQRPESHSVHHERDVHRHNYSDLPFWDWVFGTFRNPKDFACEAGFFPGASARLPQLLLFRDVAGGGYEATGRPSYRGEDSGLARDRARRPRRETAPQDDRSRASQR